MSNLRIPGLLSLANGQSCTNCGAEDGTIVAAHSNWSRHGKGKSIKAHDIFHAHLCFKCHSWLDQGTGYDPSQRFTSREKLDMFLRAMEKTWVRLWESGAVGITLHKQGAAK